MEARDECREPEPRTKLGIRRPGILNIVGSVDVSVDDVTDDVVVHDVVHDVIRDVIRNAVRWYRVKAM